MTLALLNTAGDIVIRCASVCVWAPERSNPFSAAAIHGYTRRTGCPNAPPANKHQQAFGVNQGTLFYTVRVSARQHRVPSNVGTLSVSTFNYIIATCTCHCVSRPSCARVRPRPRSSPPNKCVRGSAGVGVARSANKRAARTGSRALANANARIPVSKHMLVCL